MTLTIYHLENSRSLRIIWLAEELGLDYEIDHSARDPKTFLGPARMKDIHPQGSFPTIEHDGLVLPESGAITEYMIDLAGASGWKRVPGQAGYGEYLYWLHYAEATLMPLLVFRLILGRAPQGAPALIRPIAKKVVEGLDAGFVDPRLKQQLALIEEYLEGRSYFVGEAPTGADVMMSFPLEAAYSRVDMSAYPNIDKFVRTIQARPAWQTAYKKGGRYDYLLK